MTFDPTITIGAVLNALVLLVGFAVAFTRIGGQIALLAQRLKAVEDAIKEQSNNNTRIAILEERVTNHGKMIATIQNVIEDLRHCRGLVAEPRSGGDGAY